MGEGKPRVLTVRIAEMGIVRSDGEGPGVLRTTLGSCVGVIISDAAAGIHGLAHVLLPRRVREDKAAGKYADSAVAALVREMERAGSSRSDMAASVVGGARMFGQSGSSSLPHIGEENVAAVLQALEGLGIPVVFKDIGGECGRTVTFDGSGPTPQVRTLAGGGTR